MQQAAMYLDFNATTPIAPTVAEAMRPYLYENFGNPSSMHGFGSIANTAHLVGLVAGCVLGLAAWGWEKR